MQSLYLNHNEFANDCKLSVKRRKQNHKISFHFFAGSPHTPRRKWIGKEIFGFGLRPKGARGAQYSLHRRIGAYDLGKSHHALRACVSRQNPADFVHTMFELHPRNTANFHFCPKRQERACREATRNAIFALRAKVFSETEKARGRERRVRLSKTQSNTKVLQPIFLFALSGDVKRLLISIALKLNFQYE
jgi:hypothetical protein